MKKLILFFLLISMVQFPAFSQPCSTTGSELVTNGGFETCTPSPCSGTHVTSQQPDYSPDYTPATCSGYAGAYHITSNANACYNRWLPAGTGDGFTAHTGSYAMLVDGDGINQLWCQTVAVSPGTTYQFSAWYQNAVNSSYAPGNIPSLQLTVNGSPITSSMSTVAYLGGWEQNICLWQAPAGVTSAAICIEISATGGSSGNDLLIDDISFKAVTGGGCTAGTCTFTGPVLPVNLVSFVAKRSTEETVRLEWKTSEEINSSYFAVERSEDGINFKQIGTTKAYGNTHQLQNYFLLDEQLPLMYESLYYRLRVVDLDGKQEYSKVEKILLNETSFSIFPIPVSSGEALTVFYSSSEEEADVTISLLSSLGIYLYSATLSSEEENNEVILKTEGLAPGIYLVEVKNSFGKSFQKIIIE